MSHDRGCFRCFEDHPYQHAKVCAVRDCPYKEKPAKHMKESVAWLKKKIKYIEGRHIKWPTEERRIICAELQSIIDLLESKDRSVRHRHNG